MSINALIASPGFEVWTQGEPLDVGVVLADAARQAARLDLFDRASRRQSADVLRRAAAECGRRVDADADRARRACARWSTWTRSSDSSRRSRIRRRKAAAADAAEAGRAPPASAWCWRRRTRWISTTRDCRTSARGGSAACRPSATRRECSTASKARTTRRVRSRGNRSAAVRPHQPRVPDAQRARGWLTLFQSRWALSYLRGPLGRDEIKKLTAGSKASMASAATASTSSSAQSTPPSRLRRRVEWSGARPFPPASRSIFRPMRPRPVASPLRPVIYGAANVRFTEPKLKIDTTKLVNLTTSVTDGAVPVDWENASRVEWAPEMLENDPPDGARFSNLPSAASKAKNYDAWTKQLTASLCSTEAFELFKSPSTGEMSRPTNRSANSAPASPMVPAKIAIACWTAVRKKYAPRQAALEEKLRRANQAVDRESEQATGQKLQTAISVRRDASWRAARAESAQCRHHWPRHHRGARRRPLDEGSGRHRTGEANRRRRRRATQATRRPNSPPRPPRWTQRTTSPLKRWNKITIKPKKSNIVVKLVGLVWTK